MRLRPAVSSWCSCCTRSCVLRGGWWRPTRTPRLFHHGHAPCTCFAFRPFGHTGAAVRQQQQAAAGLPCPPPPRVSRLPCLSSRLTQTPSRPHHHVTPPHAPLHSPLLPPAPSHACGAAPFFLLPAGSVTAVAQANSAAINDAASASSKAVAAVRGNSRGRAHGPQRCRVVWCRRAQPGPWDLMLQTPITNYKLWKIPTLMRPQAVAQVCGGGDAQAAATALATGGSERINRWRYHMPIHANGIHHFM